jgi:hypothetical protein
METLQKVALVFTIIGAIVWGLIGLFDFNLVDYIFVDMLNISFLAKLIYIIVGVCGLINIGILTSHIENK